jgi:hypothetical protein
MSAFSLIARRLALGAFFVAVIPAANAQVTLHLTTTQQTLCDAAIADPQGLRLVPGGGTVFQASGVTLTGVGCGSGAENFAATVSPSSGSAGNQVNVNWSASASAAQCFFAGQNGILGWPVGTAACTSTTTCAGSHTVAVTAPLNAGAYTLGMVCTNASGVGQGSMTVTGAPPQPNPFVLTVPTSTVNANTAFPVSWTVSNATSCTGSASLNGSSTSLPGWTDSTSATSPRSVTASVAGTYTLGLVCSNGAGSASSQAATVTIGIGDVCVNPTLRQGNLNIAYPNTPGGGTRNNVDITNYDNIWGHNSNSDTVVTWPGRNGATVAFMNWPKTQYIAAKFHVPANVSPTMYGSHTYGTYYSGPLLKMAISHTCGDFAPSNPLCLATGRSAGDSFEKWLIAPLTNGCPLTPNTDYFINIQMDGVQPADCNNGTTCNIAMNIGYSP